MRAGAASWLSRSTAGQDGGPLIHKRGSPICRWFRTKAPADEGDQDGVPPDVGGGGPVHAQRTTACG